MGRRRCKRSASFWFGQELGDDNADRVFLSPSTNLSAPSFAVRDVVIGDETRAAIHSAVVFIEVEARGLVSTTMAWRWSGCICSR